MKTPLSAEQRHQLATVLAYCREMGGVDFYRGEHDLSAQAPGGIPSLPEMNSAPNPLPLETLPIMPPKSSLLVSPVAIDFSSPAITPEARVAALAAIRQEIGDCTRCQLAFEGRHKIVFGDGDPNAELLFVGEGPGADEDAQGIPFVGRAGQLLNNMITAMGLSRQRVYIANIVKCRPPKNRVPEPVEANTCTQFLFQQIGVVRPKLIVALGATAATYLLGTKASLSVLRGKVHDCMGTKLIVTYHPAYLLRDPRQKAETWKDLQQAMKFLNLAPPKRGES
ncbi:MAG TPA: uracil-DNA glycosylase [Acidobacteriaceae bacterium]|nr:uracil-DNA glycosylase [Terriglobia bacterium]HVC91471.1 uracil-DNA glycosylase [Acidobacteriaceae bacterium]